MQDFHLIIHRFGQPHFHAIECLLSLLRSPQAPHISQKDTSKTNLRKTGSQSPQRALGGTYVEKGCSCLHMWGTPLKIVPHGCHQNETGCPPNLQHRSHKASIKSPEREYLSTSGYPTLLRMRSGVPHQRRIPNTYERMHRHSSAGNNYPEHSGLGNTVSCAFNFNKSNEIRTML